MPCLKIVPLFIISLLLSGKCTAGIFDKLYNIPREHRLETAETIYEDHIRPADSSYAFQQLRGLLALSLNEKDHSLESAAYSMMADKLARLQGFNSLSLQYHFNALNIARRTGDMLAIALATFKTGRYYYSFKKYVPAFEYLLKADEIFDKKKIRAPAPLEYLYIMGRIYYETGDYDKAEFYFSKKIAEDVRSNTSEKIQSYNTIANIAQQKYNYPKALYNMQQVAAIAAEKSDSLWQSISDGIIGDIYFAMQKYDSAVPFLEKAYSANSARHLWEQANENVLNLAQIKLLHGKTGEAKKYLLLAEEYLSKLVHIDYLSRGDILENRKKYFETLALFYQKTGNYGDALQSMIMLRQTEDSIYKEKDHESYKNVLIKFENQKRDAALQAVKMKNANAVFKRNIIILVLLLLIIISAFWYNHRRLKRQIKMQQLTARNILLETERKRTEDILVRAELDLRNFTANLQQKNEIIEIYKTQAEEFAMLHPQLKQDIQASYLEKLSHFTLITDKAWADFRLLFEKIYKGYIFRVREKFPSLTENDVRLICLMKLQYSPKEIAGTLGIGADAVKKAKQRLRKKINSTDNDELEAIILAI